MLAHCTGRNLQTRELTTANAYSLLGELNHYADPQHFFPGDPSAGLAPCAQKTRRSIYLPGPPRQGARGRRFRGSVDTLTTYLYHAW